MLSRSNQPEPQQEYYADSLLTVPSTSTSVFHNLVGGYATPAVAANMLDRHYGQKPEGQAAIGTLNALQLENETPGLGWSAHCK
jgi:hypothetical protein